MQVEHDEKKREYDTLQLQLESSMSRLEVEVKQYQEEIMGELKCLRLKLSAFLGLKNSHIKICMGNSKLYICILKLVLLNH